MIEPGMEYYRSLTDGESEALMLKAMHDMARNAWSGGR